MKNWTVDLRKADIVVALLLLCFAAIAIYVTTTWLRPILPGDPGAAFFPRISLAVIVLFSFFLLLQKFRSARAADMPASDSDAKTITMDVSGFFVTILVSGLLVAGIAYIGFELSAFSFLFAILAMRTNRWLWSLITSVIAVAIMYFAFVIVLGVRLPLLFLPDYLDIL